MIPANALDKLPINSLYQMPDSFVMSRSRRAPLVLAFQGYDAQGNVKLVGDPVTGENAYRLPLSVFMRLAKPVKSPVTGYVVGFMFSPSREYVVLIHKVKPAWQADRWNGVGGKIEAGESPEAAMSREFLEETGVATSPHAWRPVCTYRCTNATIHFFSTLDFNYQKVETKTDETVQVIAVEDLGDYDVIFNLQWLIPLALDQSISLPIDVSEPNTPAEQVL